MRIIYIDDDIDDREFFSDAIKAIDPRIFCITFDNTEDSLDYLERDDVTADFIFVDINMPRMNGYEAVREIRTITQRKRVHIVMLTTSISPGDVREFGKSGIQVLIKPSKMEDLVQSVRSIFRRAGQLEEKH